MSRGGRRVIKGKKGYGVKLYIGFSVVGILLGVTPWINNATSIQGVTGIIGTMNLAGNKLADEDAIQLEWNAKDQSEPYTYQVYSKKPSTKEFQSISAVDLNKEVKVLNVYPDALEDITYTTWDGTTRTLRKAGSAERWMEEPNEYNDKGFGMGLIDVDPVRMLDFTKDPEGYLKDETGEYVYDVIFFGSKDGNGGQQISTEVADVTLEFVGTGRGVLIGHDTLQPLQNDANQYYARFAPLINIELKHSRPADSYRDETWNYTYTNNLNATTKATVYKDGLITKYPWEVGDIGKTLTIPYTHTVNQEANGDIWMKLGETSLDNYGSNLNFYLTTWNNAAMIQTGHSNGSATLDEQKILANTLFYLSQLTTDTALKDNSAMDVYAPGFNSTTVNVAREDSKIKVDFPDAKENEEYFDYYVESTGVNTGEVTRSETVSVTNTSGFAGYSYVSDSNPTTVPDNKVDTTESKLELVAGTTQPKYTHVVAVDNKGNSSEPLHITLDDTKPTVETTLSPEGWTMKDVVIKVNAKDDSSGVLNITLPNGAVVNGNNAEYKVTTNGDYTFKVTDKAGNVNEHKYTVSNIDKKIPKVYADVVNKEWTRDTVDIEVATEETSSGLTGIEMINSPEEGRNYLKDSGIDIRKDKNSGTSLGNATRYVVEGLDLNKTFYSKPFTLSYYQNSVGSRELNPTSPDWGKDRFGVHGAIGYIENNEEKTYYPFDGNLGSSTKGKVVTQTYTFNKKNITGYAVAIQPYAKPAQDNDEVWVLKDVKLEVGTTATPWTPAPEDIQLINNKKVYPVATNGMYTFKASYNNGASSETSVNVTNIDRGLPTAIVTGNSGGWVEEGTLTLTVNAQDTQSGVKSITLPDGKVIYSNVATYTVNENKDYKFIVTDNVGNTYTHTETVEKLMIPYSFYIYDSNGDPVEGAGFDLLRDGIKYTDAVSDSTGLVDFGKVPPVGKYTVKQTKAPNGHVVNPGEKDVEIGDTTDPEEFISYPRGGLLPATGTKEWLTYISVVLMMVVTGLAVRVKKRNLTK